MVNDAESTVSTSDLEDGGDDSWPQSELQSAWFSSKEPEQAVIIGKTPASTKAQVIQELKNVNKLEKMKKTETSKPEAKTEKVIQQQAILLQELILMGFPSAKAKRAIEKSSSTALNDMIDLILKDTEVDDQPTKVVEKKEYQPYTCETCTYINASNPSPNC